MYIKTLKIWRAYLEIIPVILQVEGAIQNIQLS